jgi:uncharacterized protein
MEEQIDFKNHQGEKLAATLHLPKKPTGCGVVLGHCFTCSRHTGILRQVAGELSRKGFFALRFDFSGNGQSEGIFEESTYSKQISEMQTAMESSPPAERNGSEWPATAWADWSLF